MGRWWIDRGLLDTDPTRDPRKRSVPATDGHAPWTDSDAATFRARRPIGTMQRLAFELLLLTGAARAAGIDGKSAHGVRKYLATYMAERGATEARRLAILGHATTAQTRDYSRTADARKIICGTDFANSSDPIANSDGN